MLTNLVHVQSRVLVFLKYPIIGVLVEAVGFMGLFGSVSLASDSSRQDCFLIA